MFIFLARSRYVLSIALTAAVVCTVPAPSAASPVYRAFRQSYWNRPLPKRAPISADSHAMIRYLIESNIPDYVHLSGATSDGMWGMPIYWGTSADPTYDVRTNCETSVPREFGAIEIPAGAQPDPTSDSAMTVYNRGRHKVFGLWHARYDATQGTWTSCGGTVYYLRSNGLDGDLAQSDNRHNVGHRGFPPPTWGIRLDEIQAGEIRHVLKIQVDVTKCAHVFPAVGDECGTSDPYAPPEGTRIRIRPGVDLTKLQLSRPALVVARALQVYGAVIGDQSGGQASIKLENTVAEGRGYLWNGVLNTDSLSRIPLRYFQVIKLGYGRRRR
jgi:hypothetical protein